MNKIKLFAIGNQNNFNYYVFEKKQIATEKIIKLISKIFEEDIRLYDEEYSNDEEMTSVKRNFEKLSDFHEGVVGDNRIDMFFGERKVFLTISCPLDLREKFNQELGKITKMPKEKRRKLNIK